MNYIVVSDGGKKNDMAYGSFKIFDKSGAVLKHQQFFLGDYTNNSAEYLAIIKAAQACRELELEKVEFRTDSLLVVNQINYVYKVRKPHLKTLRKMLARELRMGDKVVHINNKEVKKILGH